MATNHTTNYALNLWEASDKFVREEFNENTTKLDAAIKAVDAKADTKADAAAVTAINTALAGAVKFACGTYTGDGAEYRTINVGFTPKAVLLFDSYGTVGSGGSGRHTTGGLIVTGSPLIFIWSGQIQNAAEIVSGGFQVRYKYVNADYDIRTNMDKKVFNYVALG